MRTAQRETLIVYSLPDDPVGTNERACSNDALCSTIALSGSGPMSSRPLGGLQRVCWHLVETGTQAPDVHQRCVGVSNALKQPRFSAIKTTFDAFLVGPGRVEGGREGEENRSG
jgi:hypothetical protein